MKHTLEKCINTVQRNRQKFRRYLSVFLVLSMITTLGVNWGLHQNGISLAQTSDYICGLPEHTHTDDCYEKVLICGYDENGYPIASASNAAAKDTTAASAETGAAETKAAETAAAESAAAETEAETASADTASASNALAESAAKTDADSTLEDIFASLTGTGLHGTLTAGAETASVFAETAAAAAAAQTAVHVHTDACYEMKLICGLEEHIHTPSCLGSDISAGRETAKDWEATLPTDDELTGIWADDLVRVALSQLGYTECIENYVLDEKGEEQRSYSRYGAWYGNEYGEWNAMFVAFCLHYANVPTDSVPVNSGCQSWAAKLKNEAVDLYRAAADYTPKAGDLIFFDQNEDGRADRMGIVEAVTIDEETGALTRIDTIEGDVEGTVAECGYEGIDATILGYGEMPEVQLRSIDTEHYTVTVTYGPNAQIPDDAVFWVTEYPEDSEEYQAACAETGESYDWLLDIGFYVNGEEIEPAAPVYISVQPMETENETADEDSDDESEDEIEDENETASASNGRKKGKTAAHSASNAKTADVKDRTKSADSQDTAQNTDAENADAQTDEKQKSEKKITHFAADGIESVIGELNETKTTFSLGSLSLAGQVTDWGPILVDTSLLSDTPVNEFNVYADDEVSEGGTPTNISGAKTGTTGINGLNDAKAIYASDAATSNIESQFTGSKDQDGKVATDKSVVYGHDDYGAFDAYDAGSFSVTLSALAQEYDKYGNDTYKVPLDVVFVLDVSNSMGEAVSSDDETAKCTAMVNAVNKAMKYIYSENSLNRVGIALFSSSAGILLPLDKYTSGDRNGNFIQSVSAGWNESAGHYNYDVEIVSLGVTGSNSGRHTGGAKDKDGNAFKRGGGTYTQAGIAFGNKIFQDVTDTGYTVQTEKGNTVTGTRQPVFILLSDGVPTHGNDRYSDVYDTLVSNGSGDGQDGDDKVVEGYYTIMSANYYKQAVTNKYDGTTAKFYTIGEGIKDVENLSESRRDDETAYANAVLNPSSTVMGILNDLKGTRVTRLKGMLSQSDSISDGQSYTVRTYYTGQGWNKITYTEQSTEEYYRSAVQAFPNYSYADGAFFGNMNDTELEDAFKTMINNSVTLKQYYFALATGTQVSMSDAIGTGMELKSAPKLYFGKQAYEPTSSSTISDDVTTYTYNYKVSYGEAYPDVYKNGDNTHHPSSKEVDLSQITVTVTKDKNGDQTVQMQIPAEIMPVLYPNNAQSGYHRETPIRLIYQVGPTAEVLKSVSKLEDGKTIDLYTNQWSGEGSSPAVSSFQTSGDNNKYSFGAESETKEKGEENHVSGTDPNYFQGSQSGDQVTQVLGNNGKLTLKKGGTTDITVKKVWIDSKSETEYPEVTVHLYRTAAASSGTAGDETENEDEIELLSDEGEKIEIGKEVEVTGKSPQKLNAGNNWTYTWEDLPLRDLSSGVTYTYRVAEDPVDGYHTNYESKTDENTGNVTWTITNISEANTGLSVKKVWKRSSGEEIEDTSKLPAISAELWQKDTELKQEDSVTLTIKIQYTNYYQWWWSWHTETKEDTISVYSDVKKGGDFDGSLSVYNQNNERQSIESINVSSGSANANKYGNYGIQVNNINEDTTILIKINNENDNHYNLSGTPTIQEVSFNQPGTIAGSTENKSLGSFTLSADNNWQRFWTAEDLNEQAGHTYSYWVTESKVTGYQTSVDYKSEDIALTPSEGDKTITITNTQEALALTVKKVWDDDGADRPEKITVYLLKDGERTGNSVELTAENNWTAVFDNLDVGGDYSVEEEISGDFKYTIDYDLGEVTYAGSGYRWVRADGFSDGETYLIVTSPDVGDDVIGMQAASDGKSFAWTQGKEGGKNAGTVRVSADADGTTYITNEEAMKHTDMQWTAKSVGLQEGKQVGYRYAFSLQNVKTQTYAKNNGQGDMTENVADKEGWFYYGYALKDAKGEEAERKPNEKYTPAEKWQYVIGSMNDYFLLDNNHAGDGNSQGAQTFYLYKRVETKGYTQTATITNHKSYSLPSTGGAGTTPFTVGGSVLTGAALLYGYHLMRKREGGTE